MKQSRAYRLPENVYLINTKTGSFKTFSTPNPAFEGLFGQSVAISESTVAIGAPAESPPADVLQGGNAYTFEASTGNLLKTYASPSPEVQGHFGWSVAISGSTLVVGAKDETDSLVSFAGNAYSFRTITGNLISTFSTPNPHTVAILEGLLLSVVTLWQSELPSRTEGLRSRKTPTPLTRPAAPSQKPCRPRIPRRA